jgi:hypothetical protein
MKNTWKLAPLAFALFLTANFSAPASADKPICQVLCATTHCTSNADCPVGHCDFVCPGEGCCSE